jgi:hypothetical protein
MPTLWTFGDSLTAEFSEKYEWSNSYIKWKKYKPKVYGEILSEKLNFKLQNLGIGGSDNYTIFQTFCDISNRIRDNDLVIFGWSSPVRFRVSNLKNGWHTYLPGLPKNLEAIYSAVENISLTTVNEILINRDDYVFCGEVNSWIKMINHYLKNMKTIHWTAFDNRLNVTYVKNLETIMTETNGEVVDNHFSENGHYELSEMLLRVYSSKITPRIL